MAPCGPKGSFLRKGVDVGFKASGLLLKEHVQLTATMDPCGSKSLFLRQFADVGLKRAGVPL